jgi:hypothetical protein
VLCVQILPAGVRNTECHVDPTVRLCGHTSAHSCGMSAAAGIQTHEFLQDGGLDPQHCTSCVTTYGLLTTGT